MDLLQQKICDGGFFVLGVTRGALIEFQNSPWRTLKSSGCINNKSGSIQSHAANT
jgi:glycosyltransferase A (GT-A) superfamily protein (DUF2064 family)